MKTVMSCTVRVLDADWVFTVRDEKIYVQFARGGEGLGRDSTFAFTDDNGVERIVTGYRAVLWLAEKEGQITLSDEAKKLVGFPWVRSKYCTQNNGDCETCSLVSYGRDCRNQRVKSN